MEEVDTKLSVADQSLPRASTAVPKQSVAAVRASHSPSHHGKKSMAVSHRHTVSACHPGVRNSTFFHDGAPHRSPSVLPHHTRSTHSKDEREKVFFLIPREVKITFGSYVHLGILDYRTERLSGLQRSLKKCGAVVTLKPTFHINEVRAWHLEQPFFKCNITELQHGGDGELDRLCMDAGRAFEKSVRRAYINLKYRYSYETSDQQLRTGCACDGLDPAFIYYERPGTGSTRGSAGGAVPAAPSLTRPSQLFPSASLVDIDEEVPHHHDHGHGHGHQHHHHPDEDEKEESRDEEDNEQGRKHSHRRKHRQSPHSRHSSRHS